MVSRLYTSATSRLRRLSGAGLLLGALVLAALAVRLVGLDREPVWLDEASTLYFSRLSLSELVLEARDTHPPLFYLVQKVAAPLGDTPFALRLPAAIFGVLTVLATFWLGRIAARDKIGLLAAAFMAVSAAAVAASQDARHYTLLSLSATLAAAVALRVLAAYERGATAPVWTCVAYTLAMATTLYVHSIAVFLLAVTGAVGLAVAAQAPGWWCVRQWVLMHCAIGIAWMGWLPVVVRQSLSGLKQMAWLQPPSPEEAVGWLAQLYGASGIARFQVAIAAALVAVTFWFIVRDRRLDLPVAYLAALAFGVPALMLLVTFAGHSVFMPRTIAWLAPFFFVLVAIALGRTWRWGIALVVGMVLVRGLWNHTQLPHNEDWRALMPRLAAELRPTDAVWTMDVLNDAALRYYWYRLPAGALPVNVVLVHGPALPPEGTRVWIVVRDFDRGSVLASLQATRHVSTAASSRVTARGMTALLYE